MRNVYDDNDGQQTTDKLKPERAKKKFCVHVNNNDILSGAYRYMWFKTVLKKNQG